MPVADVDHLLLTTAQTSPSQLVLGARHCGPFSYQRGDMLYDSQKRQPQGSDQLLKLSFGHRLSNCEDRSTTVEPDWTHRTALQRYDNVSEAMQGSM